MSLAVVSQLRQPLPSTLIAFMDSLRLSVMADIG
jgi:hypothetical protein